MLGGGGDGGNCARTLSRIFRRRRIVVIRGGSGLGCRGSRCSCKCAISPVDAAAEVVEVVLVVIAVSYRV